MRQRFSLARSLRITVGPEEVERDVRLVADDPTVVRRRRDVEDTAGREVEHLAPGHRGDGVARDDEADVLDLAEGRAGERADVRGPLPARLVRRAPDGEPADADDLEPAQLELARLVGLLEALQDDFVHSRLLLTYRRAGTHNLHPS